MITILKFPIYVQIESGNVDRALVSKASKETLYPLLLEYLASARVKSGVLEKVSKEVGSPVSIQLLTEIDLINRTVSREVPSTFKID